MGNLFLVVKTPNNKSFLIEAAEKIFTAVKHDCRQAVGHRPAEAVRLLKPSHGFVALQPKTSWFLFCWKENILIHPC